MPPPADPCCRTTCTSPSPRPASGTPSIFSPTPAPPPDPAVGARQVAAAPLHVAGVSVPGAPFVVSGHNDHVAWGFTNLGADVQDVYIEHLRGTGSAEPQGIGASPAATEFQTSAGTWAGLFTAVPSSIRVRGGRNVSLEILSTLHGDVETPLLNPLLSSESRAISLRWTLYTPGPASLPFDRAAAATSAAAVVEAFRSYTGPSQNLVVADDAGNIAYHAIGQIPLRGSASNPASLSPVPTDVDCTRCPHA